MVQVKPHQEAIRVGHLVKELRVNRLPHLLFGEFDLDMGTMCRHQEDVQIEHVLRAGRRSEQLEEEIVHHLSHGIVI